MGVVRTLLGRLRRRPPDPERALQRARADAHRRAERAAVDRYVGRNWSDGGGGGY